MGRDYLHAPAALPPEKELPNQVMKVQKYKGNIPNTRVRPLAARSNRTGVGKSRPKSTVIPDGVKGVLSEYVGSFFFFVRQLVVELRW